MSSLEQMLEKLSKKKRYTFNAVEFPKREGVLVGMDKEDRICVFIRSEEKELLPTIRTSKLQVDFCKEYDIFVDNKKSQKGMFHSIICLSSSPSDMKTFAMIVDSILSDRSYQLNIRSLSTIFYSLVSLFRIGPSKDCALARQGLWGELMFMKHFGGFKKWAVYWHSDTSMLFDFSKEESRIEVKSTLRSERIHQFSHRQLYSLASDIVIASILLREDDAGISLRDLIEDARQSLKGTPYFIKLEEAVIRSAMNDSIEKGPSYNEAEAKSNIAFFPVENVPRFPIGEPEGVSGTHYQSDLTSISRMTHDEVFKWLSKWDERIAE